MSTADIRTRTRLRDHMNGAWGRLDEETRVAVSILCDELDGVNENLRRLHTAHTREVAARFDALERRLDELVPRLEASVEARIDDHLDETSNLTGDVRRWVLGLAATVIVTVLGFAIVVVETVVR